MVQKAASQGLKRAKKSLALCYREGLRDVRVEAAKGSSLATLRLGELYETGVFVRRDPPRALSLYREALGSGSAEAWHRVGRCHEQGTGTKIDIDQALKHYYAGACRSDRNSFCSLLRLMRSFVKRKWRETAPLL